MHVQYLANHEVIKPIIIEIASARNGVAKVARHLSAHNTEAKKRISGAQINVPKRISVTEEHVYHAVHRVRSVASVLTTDDKITIPVMVQVTRTRKKLCVALKLNL